MKKLAIIGASYLQLPLVLKAKEMGIKTYCFAWDDGAVCKNDADAFYPISIMEKEQILEICKELSIDGVCSIASDVAVTTVSYVASQLNLIGNKYSDAQASTDKFLMRNKFTKVKLKSPRFSLNNDEDIIRDMSFPLIVKPTDRSGSLGVVKVYDEIELKHAINVAQNLSFSKNAIVEEYISGREVSVETVSWKGEHYILAVTDKVTTGAPYFVEIEHHQPTELPEWICDKIKIETMKALSILNIEFGASHAEFKITDNGEVYIIEVGARMGGDFIGSDLVFLSTGFDFLQSVIEIALDKFSKPKITALHYSGVYFLCEETKKINELILSKDRDSRIYKKGILNPSIKPVKCSADRSGYLIYCNDSRYSI